MHISIGSDHRGYEAKAKIVELLAELGHTTGDVGANKEDSVDYPDIANMVSRRVADGVSDRGILICGTGIGMSIAANKRRGIRAAVCNDVIAAEMSRRHNDLNVLCLSAEVVGIEELVSVWLKTEFEGGRHERRVKRITDMENDF